MNGVSLRPGDAILRRKEVRTTLDVKKPYTGLSVRYYGSLMEITGKAVCKIVGVSDDLAQTINDAPDPRDCLPPP